MDLAHLHVPELGRTVHGASCHHQTVGVKRDSDDLSFVASVGRQGLSCNCIPYLGGLIEGASGYSGAIGDIKGHAIDCIFMAFKGVDERASTSIPYLAGPIIAASDKLIPVFVKAAIGQGQDVSLELLNQHELLLSLLLDLFN
jgi:hypothetical protein